MPEAMSPRVKAALDECRWMIIQGSKSFSLAARLFDPDIRDAAFFLYWVGGFWGFKVVRGGVVD